MAVPLNKKDVTNGKQLHLNKAIFALVNLHNTMVESHSPDKLILRTLRMEDYEDLKAAMTESYAGMGGAAWTREQIQLLLNQFPKGQLCIEIDGRVVACALALIIDYARFGDSHTYEEVTGNYTFNTHNPNGDVLYGIDVFVSPEHQGLRLARRLYDGRKELCESLNLSGIVAGGRIPGYQNHADTLSPKEYIEKVKMKELYDPILTFQLSNDFHVRKVLRNYLAIDRESKAFATLLEWNNLYYDAEEKLINTRKSVVRIGLVQWQMRPVTSLDQLLSQIEFFMDAVSDYKSDFILFPELFDAPLMAQFNELHEAKAIRELAGFTEILRERFREMAVSYNINVIAGSMPLLEEEKLYNVSYLCRRDGTWDEYRKIHITPAEASAWGMHGGNKLGIFDTDAGRIGVLICYDSEFPELARLYAQQGVEILFVPFLTDTQTGYNRVRLCAQARAVENECYVAIAGCVGNLPKVNNMDIQYAQSAVFSPSDFSFPSNAIVAEATPNTEMTVIADINRDLLRELHNMGSVRNLKDRRTDLYQLTAKTSN